MPRILSVTLEVPFEGITDAGGEFVRRHYMVLSSMGDLTVVGRRTEQNLAAAENPSPEGLATQIVASSRWGTRWLRPVRVITNAFTGLALGKEFSRPLFKAVRQLDLRSIDIIEFQWIESGQWVRKFRSLAPQARMILVAHDVLSQRRKREYEAASSPVGRVKAWARWKAALAAERRMFPHFDAIAVLSEKDRDLIARISPAAEPFVLRPWLTPVASEHPPVPALKGSGATGPTVLFTGAMWRRENDDAACWLVNEVWPAVITEVPDARLVIAGARPSETLRSAATRGEHIEITGFVEDLDTYYAEADVFACPLRFGAGVKFKTIAAQLAGLPIVSTRVGAEGVGGEFVGLTEDPHEFAQLLIGVLDDLPEWRKRSRAIQSDAWDRFGKSAYEETVKFVYTASDLTESAGR